MKSSKFVSCRAPLNRDISKRENNKRQFDITNVLTDDPCIPDLTLKGF